MHSQGGSVGLGQTGCGPIGVGQQRIVHRARGQGAFGGSDHDRHVDVEPDRSGRATRR